MITNLIGVLTNNMVLFFAFFMLTEPKTSPLKESGRLYYGITTAVLAVALFYVLPGFALPLALLISNSLARLINWKQTGML
jgi:Na+-translocating ferredoxin:NAD+ oxidoreductase RnfD subunit